MELEENDGRKKKGGLIEEKKERKKRREGDAISLNLYVYAYFTKTMMTNEHLTIWDLSKVLHH
jgi:hypothetical protein